MSGVLPLLDIGGGATSDVPSVGAGGGLGAIEVPVKPIPASSQPLTAAPPDPFVIGGGKLWGRAWSLAVSMPQQASGGIYVPPGSAAQEASPTATTAAGGATFSQPTVILSQSADPNALHMTFEVTLHRVGIPNQQTMEARVYNVGSDMMNKIAQQYTLVTLQAGYVSTGMTTIFSGNVVYYEWGRDANMVDSVLVIHAVAQTLPMLSRIVNTTLPAGSTATNVAQACVNAMAQDGVGMGYCSDLGSAQSPRGRTLFGMVRDVLRDIAQSVGGTAFIDNANKLNILKQGDTLPGDTIVLNSKSGLIGVPTQTLLQGIQATALIIPGLFPGRIVQINQAAINQVNRFQDVLSGDSTEAQVTPPYPIEQDGLYTTVTVTYRGDNRGTPWYAEMVLEPLDQTLLVPSKLATQ